MRHLAGRAGQDHSLVALARALAFHAVEERRHAVIIILRPALKRMVMALGALDAGTEENLSGSLHRIIAIGRGAIKIGGRIDHRTATGSEQRRGKLIVRHIAAQSALDPAMILVHARRADLLYRKPQQIAPFQRPKLRVLRPIEQRVDQLRAFIRPVVLQKRLGFLKRGQDANHVEVHAPYKGAVVAQGRGRELQLLQFVVHVPIHVIALGRVRPLEAFHIACESQQCALDVMQITHQHRCFAAPETGNQPGGADVRHFVVGTFKHNQMRHITLCAVRVMRHYTELLLPSRMLEHAAG